MHVTARHPPPIPPVSIPRPSCTHVPPVQDPDNCHRALRTIVANNEVLARGFKKTQLYLLVTQHASVAIEAGAWAAKDD